MSTMEEIMTPSDLTRMDLQLDRVHLSHVKAITRISPPKPAHKQLSRLAYLAELI